MGVSSIIYFAYLLLFVKSQWNQFGGDHHCSFRTDVKSSLTTYSHLINNTSPSVPEEMVQYNGDILFLAHEGMDGYVMKVSMKTGEMSRFFLSHREEYDGTFVVDSKGIVFVQGYFEQGTRPSKDSHIMGLDTTTGEIVFDYEFIGEYATDWNAIYEDNGKEIILIQTRNPHDPSENWLYAINYEDKKVLWKKNIYLFKEDEMDAQVPYTILGNNLFLLNDTQKQGIFKKSHSRLIKINVLDGSIISSENIQTGEEDYFKPIISEKYNRIYLFASLSSILYAFNLDSLKLDFKKTIDGYWSFPSMSSDETQILLVGADILSPTYIKFISPEDGSEMEEQIYLEDETCGGDITIMALSQEKTFAVKCYNNTKNSEHQNFLRIQNSKLTDVLDTEGNYPDQFIVDGSNCVHFTFTKEFNTIGIAKVCFEKNKY